MTRQLQAQKERAFRAQQRDAEEHELETNSKKGKGRYWPKKLTDEEQAAEREGALRAKEMERDNTMKIVKASRDRRVRRGFDVNPGHDTVSLLNNPHTLESGLITWKVKLDY